MVVATAASHPNGNNRAANGESSSPINSAAAAVMANHSRCFRGPRTVPMTIGFISVVSFEPARILNRRGFDRWAIVELSYVNTRIPDEEQRCLILFLGS
jgi:hypothetical protein